MRSKPRILFYVHDSRGLGHVKRISNLARALKSDAACLILCGNRQAAVLVPDECEYLHIPSLDSLTAERAKMWGSGGFLGLSLGDAIAFRRPLIEAAVKSFNPDVIVVENYPLGRFNELSGIVEKTSAIKFFLTRGIMTHPERVRPKFLNVESEQALSDQYRNIIVALDQKIWDLTLEYGLSEKINQKVVYVGYMSEPVKEEVIAGARAARGIPNGHTWIVCSAGGGALGEQLIESFVALVPSLPEVVVDIVQGPRSSLKWSSFYDATSGAGEIRLHRYCPSLPLLHAAADLVVSTGSYNSLAEAMEGGAEILCAPVQPKPDDEQFLHASRLARHYPITIINQLDNLGGLIKEHARRKPHKLPIRRSLALEFDGLRNARDLIMSCLD